MVIGPEAVMPYKELSWIWLDGLWWTVGQYAAIRLIEKDIDRSLRIMNMLDVVVDYGTVHGDEAVRKDIN